MVARKVLLTFLMTVLMRSAPEWPARSLQRQNGSVKRILKIIIVDILAPVLEKSSVPGRQLKTNFQENTCYNFSANMAAFKMISAFASIL